MLNDKDISTYTWIPLVRAYVEKWEAVRRYRQDRPIEINYETDPKKSQAAYFREIASWLIAYQVNFDREINHALGRQ